MAGAGGRDATRGEGEPRGGQHLPPLCPGPLGRALAAPERTRGSDYRAVWRRLHRGLRASGRRRAVLGRIAGTLPAVQPSATPRADAAERVWALCGRTTAAVWSRDASDMRLPRVTHRCRQTRRGKLTGRRQTIAKRRRQQRQEVKATLRQRRHWPIPQQGAWLRSVLLGH